MTDQIYDSDVQCPECGQTLKIGRIPLLYNVPFMLLCPCQEAKLQAERIQNANVGAELIKLNMRKNSGLLKKWYGKTFENFIPREGQGYAYEKALEFAKSYRNGKGLILCGAAGCGKTHLASAIVNKIISDLIINQADAEETGRMNGIMNSRVQRYAPAIFASTVEFLSEIKSTYNTDGESTQNIIGKYKTSQVLILDDMGTENVSEWVREKMFEVINYRYGEEMPLVITTNKTPEELNKDYGQRIFDRIREMCVFVTIDTPSQRLTAG